MAVEARERFTEDNVEVRGVEVQEDYNEEKDIRTTVVKITTENGARAMGRPQGTYITIESEGLSAPDEDYHREVSEELSRHLRQLIGLEKEKSVLIVGLENPGITADSLGPEVIGNLHMTRHLIREYGLKSNRKADSSCNQRNCSRSNGADWNGNFGNRRGRGGNNTARCSDRCGCSCRKKYQAP